MEESKFLAGANLARETTAHAPDKETYLGEAADVSWESYWIDLGGEG